MAYVGVSPRRVRTTGRLGIADRVAGAVRLSTISTVRDQASKRRLSIDGKPFVGFEVVAWGAARGRASSETTISERHVQGARPSAIRRTSPRCRPCSRSARSHRRVGVLAHGDDHLGCCIATLMLGCTEHLTPTRAVARRHARRRCDRRSREHRASCAKPLEPRWMPPVGLAIDDAAIVRRAHHGRHSRRGYPFTRLFSARRPCWRDDGLLVHQAGRMKSSGIAEAVGQRIIGARSALVSTALLAGNALTPFDSDRLAPAGSVSCGAVGCRRARRQRDAVVAGRCKRIARRYRSRRRYRRRWRGRSAGDVRRVSRC